MKQAQSYNSVVMRCDFSIYEMRIMLFIVKRAQSLYQGRKYSDVLKAGICTDGINMNFAIPISELLGGKSHNYEPLKESIRRMEKEWHVEYYDGYNRIWHTSSVIYNVSLEERTGLMKFSSAKWLMDYIADFKNGGYRIYDFELAMSLRNVNSARLYLLMCSQNSERTIGIEDLKKMLGAEGKYKQAGDFVKRCIEPAKKELEDKKCNGFVYSINREYNRKRGKVVSLTFKPIKREEDSINISKQKELICEKIDNVLVNYLTYQLRFSMSEIKGNAKTLQKFQTLPDWQRIFGDIVDRARRKRKNHGYIIAAMKKEIDML